MSPFGIDFDTEAFAREYLRRRVTGWLNQFFDGFGTDNLVFAIRNDKNLIDYMPVEKKRIFIRNARVYKDYADFLSDYDVYSSLSDDWKVLIEEQPDGQAWAYRQIATIRNFFFPS